MNIKDYLSFSHFEKLNVINISIFLYYLGWFKLDVEVSRSFLSKPIRGEWEFRERRDKNGRNVFVIISKKVRFI